MASKKTTGCIGRSDNHTPHCECCGKENPQVDDGYTTCCNEGVCYGSSNIYPKLSRYGTETVWAEACCWSEAEKVFKQAGIKIPKGSSRLFD